MSLGSQALNARIERNRLALAELFSSALRGRANLNTHARDLLTELMGGVDKPPGASDGWRKSFLGQSYALLCGVTKFEHDINELKSKQAISVNIYKGWKDKFEKYRNNLVSERKRVDTLLANTALTQEALYRLYIDLRLVSWQAGFINANVQALKYAATTKAVWDAGAKPPATKV